MRRQVSVQAAPTTREIETQTDVSLPQRVACIWQGHVSEQLAVIDGQPAPMRAKPTDISSSEIDSDDDPEIIENLKKSADDLRRMHIYEDEGPEIAGVDSLEDEEFEVEDDIGNAASSVAGTTALPVCCTVFVPPPPDPDGESSRSSFFDFKKLGEAEVQEEMKISLREQNSP